MCALVLSAADSVAADFSLIFPDYGDTIKCIYNLKIRCLKAAVFFTAAFSYILRKIFIHTFVCIFSEGVKVNVGFILRFEEIVEVFGFG